MIDVGRVGKRGTVVIPPRMLRRYGLEEGCLLVLEEGPEGLTLRRAADEELLETYTTQRRAEFLLQNAVDEEDDAQARFEVRRLGLDPAAIPHERP
ncbi:MAG: AbrB/MazE/SpoVT family DNA-binding domain-containing protein [Thermodesulfobacteriota bacterium]